jgi:hypothetical protein
MKNVSQNISDGGWICMSNVGSNVEDNVWRNVEDNVWANVEDNVWANVGWNVRQNVWDNVKTANPTNEQIQKAIDLL